MPHEPDELAPDLATREIAHEQGVVDRVYAQLEVAARNAQLLATEGHSRARLGHEGGLVERDAMVFQAAKRIATLDAAHEGLVFGRLDLRDPTVAPRYVGRIGLRDFRARRPGRRGLLRRRCLRGWLRLGG